MAKALTGQAKGRILFLDDDRDMREMVEVLLGHAGYEVATASTAGEGLGLAKKESFDLILLDWRLEDGSGLDLCRKIRAFDPHTPVFFYTGVASNSATSKALEAGAQGFFIKPVEVDYLLATISAQVQNGRGHGVNR